MVHAPRNPRKCRTGQYRMRMQAGAHGETSGPRNQDPELAQNSQKALSRFNTVTFLSESASDFDSVTVRETMREAHTQLDGEAPGCR